MQKPIPFGKYCLLDRISVGGMAEVFKAKTFGVKGFTKIIAIKRILPSMAEDREFVTMFIDEAKIAVQLNHANICQIYELGKINSSHYIAMEYIHGKDLLQLQNRFRRDRILMPKEMACFTMQKVCEGLEYAHRKKDTNLRDLGLVHRDISPQNVIISFDGEVKIIDFGIAKASSRSTRTQVGVLKGKFGYMSPEQVRGLILDRRSDIFAAGTVLYEILANRRLFVADSDFATLEKVRKVDIEPPHVAIPGMDGELEAILLKALAREREERYQWGREMADALGQYLARHHPGYGTKQLADWMRSSFRDELAEEKRKMEVFAQLTSAEDLKNWSERFEAPRPTRENGHGAAARGLDEQATTIFAYNAEAMPEADLSATAPLGPLLVPDDEPEHQERTEALGVISDEEYARIMAMASAISNTAPLAAPAPDSVPRAEITPPPRHEAVQDAEPLTVNLTGDDLLLEEDARPAQAVASSPSSTPPLSVIHTPAPNSLAEPLRASRLSAPTLALGRSELQAAGAAASAGLSLAKPPQPRPVAAAAATAPAPSAGLVPTESYSVPTPLPPPPQPAFITQFPSPAATTGAPVGLAETSKEPEPAEWVVTPNPLPTVAPSSPWSKPDLAMPLSGGLGEVRTLKLTVEEVASAMHGLPGLPGAPANVGVSASGAAARELVPTSVLEIDPRTRPPGFDQATVSPYSGGAPLSATERDPLASPFPEGNSAARPRPTGSTSGARLRQRSGRLVRDLLLGFFVAAVLIGGGYAIWAYLLGPRLAELRGAATASLLISATTPVVGDFKVLFDDQEVGRVLPLSLEQLRAGHHKVRVESDTYEPYEASVELQEGGATEHKLKLHLREGMMASVLYRVVVGAPFTVFLDQKKQKEVSDGAEVVVPITPGLKQVVRIEKSGFLTFREELILQPKEKKEVTVELRIVEGVIKLTSDPPHATVFLDGRKVGWTPFLSKKLQANHDFDLRLKLAGYEEWQEDVRFDSDHVLFERKVDLAPLGAPRPVTAPNSSEKDGYLTVTAGMDTLARVFVDGKDTGKSTPISDFGKIPLPPGEHTVMLKQGSRTVQDRVTIESGKTLRLKLRF